MTTAELDSIVDFQCPACIDLARHDYETGAQSSPGIGVRHVEMDFVTKTNALVCPLCGASEPITA